MWSRVLWGEMLPLNGMLPEMLQSNKVYWAEDGVTGGDNEAPFLQDIIKCSPGPHPGDTIHPLFSPVMIPRLDLTSSATSWCGQTSASLLSVAKGAQLSPGPALQGSAWGGRIPMAT